MRGIQLISIALLFSAALLSCNKDDGGNTPASIPPVYDNTPYQLEFGLLPPPPIAEDNALTIQGVKLGRMLFYENRLSGNNSQNCASCHQQENAFTDTAQFSIGIKGLPGGRHAMAAFNLAWNQNRFFWDGRAELLRHQAVMPIQDELEMDESIENVIAKLSADTMYTNQFIRAFDRQEINEEYIGKALEQFMNSIVSVNSKYDNYLKGEVMLSDAEERGRALYFAEYNPGFPAASGADCAHCHGGLNFENDRYMNNGLDSEANQTDIGFQTVSKTPSDKAKFKVTSLRNIAFTAPYMHDGRFQTLREVIDHYDHDLQPSPTLDPALEYTRSTGLMLTEQDKDDLIAFLHTLSDYDLTTDPAYSSPFQP